MKKINFKFDISGKKIFFILSFIFFLFLLYLSIPSLYDSGRVQKDIIKKLDEDFKLNFSLSTDISYRILPKPHFLIKDCELIQLESNVSNRIAEIQDFKIFINLGNFFNKEIKIKSLNISNANFFINKSNFKYIKDFFDQKFSEKVLKINKSKIFFKDKDEEVVFIYTVKDIVTSYDSDLNKNNFIMNGELFNIFNRINWSKNFNTKKKITKINAKKISLSFQNEADFINNQYEYKNSIEIQSNKLKTKYKLNKDNVIFSSKKSLIKNTVINYEGEIDLNPFNLNLNIISQKIDFNYFFKNLSLFNELLISRLFFKKNLYAEININSDNIVKSKIFNKANLKINFQGGEINLNDSIFYSDKIGTLRFKNSKFIVDENQWLFEGNSKLNIKDLNYFYKLFLIPKQKRFEFNSIDFLFRINPKNGIIKIKKIIFYDKNNKIINLKLSENFLNEYSDDEFSYLNPIKFKNFLKKLLLNYADEG